MADIKAALAHARLVAKTAGNAGVANRSWLMAASSMAPNGLISLELFSVLPVLPAVAAFLLWTWLFARLRKLTLCAQRQVSGRAGKPLPTRQLRVIEFIRH